MTYVCHIELTRKDATQAWEASDAAEHLTALTRGKASQGKTILHQDDLATKSSGGGGMPLSGNRLGIC